MAPSAWVFWASIACVAYAYVAYPLLVALVAAFRPRPEAPGDRFNGSFSIVVAAYNEEAAIGRRLDELTRLLASSGRSGEILVVSDGSTDRTAAIAREHATQAVRVIELDTNGGKARAVSLGCAAATGDVLVFADSRQRWDPDALSCLVDNFARPEVGAVGGELILETDAGVMAGVGLYWRFEKWLRALEARIHSTVGVSGSIAAVRRVLFTPIPPGLLLDDVYWPLRVAMQGYRVAFDERARAYDRLPVDPRDEFRRKVRTLSGNFQLVSALPSALLPWRNPLWIQFVSHKLLRLAVPWAYLAAMVAGAIHGGAFYYLVVTMQAMGLTLACAGLPGGPLSRSRAASAAAAVLVLNAAAWLAFWVWASGRAGSSWGKAAYHADE